jgi:hypothetical protein
VVRGGWWAVLLLRFEAHVRGFHVGFGEKHADRIQHVLWEWLAVPTSSLHDTQQEYMGERMFQTNVRKVGGGRYNREPKVGHAT